MGDTPFNDALANIRLSPIVSISEEVRRRSPLFTEQTGKKFVLFQRGEIDFPTPSYIIEAAKHALDAGYTKYPKSGGEDALKDAILAKLARYNKVEGLSRDNVVCTYGGQEALELSFKLFAGRRGAGFAPCWSCVLENFVPYASIDFVEVPLEADFSVDFGKLERILNDVSFFYLNTPHNPTGKLFSEQEVRTIADLCARHGVHLISDEAYERIVYDGNRHFSPMSLPHQNIIGTFTFSKTYAMTGWRQGYLVTRNTRITELVKLGDYTQTAGVVTFLQYAAKAALENREEENRVVTRMVAEFQKRRDALYDGLRSIKGISVEKPEGAFYLFPNFTGLIPAYLSGRERQMYIYERLMEKGVATVYGSCFGKHFGDNVRFSFSTTPIETIREGVERMREVFSSSPARVGALS
jgi:aspartate/methionine/tyrosine aminotransferase